MEQPPNTNTTSRRVIFLFIIITGCLCSIVTFTAARTLGMVLVCLWLLASLYVIWYKKLKWLPVILGLLTMLAVFGPVDVKFTGSFKHPILQQVYTGTSLTPAQRHDLATGQAIWYGDQGLKVALAPHWLIVW
jgi:hypothetical protein